MTQKQNDYFDIKNYWIEKEKFCKSFFSRAALNGKKAFIRKFGEEEGKKWLDRVRKEYFEILPHIPYVGEIDLFQRQILLSALFAAIYRVLKKNEEIGEIWNLCNDFNKETLMSMPGFARKLLKKSTFSNKSVETFRSEALLHEKKNLADQWDFVEGDGKTFDYGMNIKKCAKVILYQKLGISEFTPYMCLIDINFAKCCDYGLVRTQVIAEGADHCDFRVSKNGPIDVKTGVTL